MDRRDLMAMPAAVANGPGQPQRAHLVSSHAEVKQSLEKFTESLHQKAVVVTTWLATVDKESGPRAAAFLGLYLHVFVAKKVENKQIL